jgi:hypothetical protein
MEIIGKIRRDAGHLAGLRSFVGRRAGGREEGAREV